MCVGSSVGKRGGPGVLQGSAHWEIDATQLVSSGSPGFVDHFL